MNDNALIIIAKYPDKDHVKTRLKTLMSDERRVSLYETLLEQTIEKLRSVPGVDTFIAFAPSEKEHYFTRFNLKLIRLGSGDLGKRMYESFKEVFQLGYGRAALVGVDIPDLSEEIILKAFGILSEKDLVYGPASDGGYYLVGMRRLIRDVFEDVPWSSSRTLSESLKKANAGSYTTGFTETLNDIDTGEDLHLSGIIY